MGYLNLVGAFRYREPLFRSKLDALAENDAQLKTDGWAQNTKTLFYQATVPTGWTLDASQNDKGLRVVGSTGGGVAVSGQALSATITLAHTHSISAAGGHTHAYANHTHRFGVASSSAPFGINYADLGGFIYRYNSFGGSTSISILDAVLTTPGALTLGTEPNHDHSGVTDSSLTNFVFAYADVIIGTKNAPGGTYTDLTAFWTTGADIDFDPFDQYADNDAYNLGNLMPSGTVMIFGQQAAPIGWTRILTTNDRMLRVVSGVGGGLGGTQLMSSGVTIAHANNLAVVGDHTHTVPSHQHLLNQSSASLATANPHTAATGYIQDSGIIPGNMAESDDAGSAASRSCIRTRTTSSGSGSTGASGGHTHALVSALADFTMAYVDVIQCSKDVAGASSVYTDMTAVFAWKKLVSKQRLNKLAANDAYIQFHTTPTGTKALFYMSSPPAGWTKDTTQHGKALRIVSGATGGSPGGGAHLLSDVISLQHTHGIPTEADHTHSMSHTHPFDTGSQSVNPNTGFQVRSRTAGGQMGRQVAVSSPFSAQQLLTTTLAPQETDTAAAGSHNHGGTTGSALSDVSLAYADVIHCTKD